MKRTRTVFLLLGLMVFMPLTNSLADAMAQTPTKASTQEAGAANAVEVGNKICPVSHEEVGTNGMAPHKVTYKGKIYNLCCGMCEKDFNKDPDKYAKIMDDEVAAQNK